MKDMTPETTPSSKPAKKQSAKKPDKSAAKAKLAAGAAAIRKAEADAKKNKKGADIGTKNPKAKRVKVDAIEVPIPKIFESKQDVHEIMHKRVIIDEKSASLVLDSETTTGEYVKIFDNLVSYGERFQLLIGDLVIAGEKLASFGGKYAAIMLGSGRKLDTLKHYRSTAFHTPKALRLLPYSHLHEVVKVPALEDKSRIIKDAAKAAKEGKMPSVQEIRKEADKCKPRKKKKAAIPAAKKEAKVRRDLTGDENAVLAEMEDAAARLSSMIEGGAFLLEAKTDSTSTLREKLDRIARFAGQLAE